MKKAQRVTIGGEEYRATVLQVLERDADGRARTFRILRDDESTSLQGGEHFWIVMASAKMLDDEGAN